MQKTSKYNIRKTMPRLGIDYETVKQTSVKLLSQGIAPSVQKIREVLGTGSNTTIAGHLKVWREEYAQKTIHHLPANIPKELISAFEVLWQTAMEQAQNQLAEYKCTIENERETALQVQLAAEKSVVDIKQKLDDLSAALEQEATKKQKLDLELAIANEHLIKKDEVLDAQKIQYEERLARVYEEKDTAIAQQYQLQGEIKALQEKITLQAEQHQNAITQQNTLHEQSEVRWLNLIDRARQETKDANKKFENLRNHNDELIKKSKTELSDSQQNAYEINIKKKFSIEQVGQLKQEIKTLETENIKHRTIIMRLEEEQKKFSDSSKNRQKKPKK